jgi:metal-responsive CopG/Arc/MetJ family transcriptional regulator
MKRKPHNNPAITAQDAVEKRSVSAPSELLQAADERMAEQRITNFSEYIRTLIRRDVESKTLPAKTA